MLRCALGLLREYRSRYDQMPRLNAASRAFWAAKLSAEFLSHNAMITLASIPVVILYASRGAISQCLFGRLQFRGCRFLDIWKMHSWFELARLELPFHRSRTAIYLPVRTPSTRRTSRGTVI